MNTTQTEQPRCYRIIMKNPNCDNDKCMSATGEVRVLPTGGDSNAILCWACYKHEMAFRRDRNRELAAECRFDLPDWESLSCTVVDTQQ